MPITTIVLTGGPCAGKSTAEELLRAKLPEFGIKPIFVKENATDVILSGISIPDMLRTPETFHAFQRTLTKTQLDEYVNKRAFAELCSAEHIALIFDRGIKDNAAYMGSSAFATMIRELLSSQQVAIDASIKNEFIDHEIYDAVIHLVSAARGVPQHYNLNNAARSETPEQAAELDQKTLDAWSGHPGLVIINNVQNTPDGPVEIPFEEKMNAVLRATCSALGLPVPIEEKKFRVTGVNMSQLPPTTLKSEIRQIYLNSEDSSVERRIRATTLVSESPSSFDTVYSYTERYTTQDGTRARRSRIISRTEFEALERDRDPSHAIIEKTRYAFTYKDQYYKLDVFSKAPNGGHLKILEVDLTQEAPTLDIPPFFKAHDVSQNPAYRTAAVARTLR